MGVKKKRQSAPKTKTRACIYCNESIHELARAYAERWGVSISNYYEIAVARMVTSDRALAEVGDMSVEQIRFEMSRNTLSDNLYKQRWQELNAELRRREEEAEGEKG